MIYHPWRRFPLAVTLLASAAASIACTLRPSPADGSASTRSAPLPSASAQALLFTYRRDDTAPGQVTRIRINAARVAASPIQQNVFGNFVEHLGGVVYEGIWAQVLLNPNLERIEERDPEPAAWNLTGGAWQEGGYLSPRCVRLADADDALSQRIFLPTHRTRKYSLTLYARTPQGAGQMTLTLRRGEGLAGPVALKVPVNVAPSGDGRWEKRTLRWQLPAGALTQGEPARFSLTHSGGKAIDVDQIEVFPDDAVNGMDPDVIAKARAWRIPLLRYPGGNFVSGYHWRDGVGPRAQRPTRRNPAWGGIEPNHFGTDEFLDFARRIGATAHFCVNAGDGTPEEAAAWVRYCNAKSLRVPVWEIGNELYGGWQIGHTDAAGNAARFVRFRDAMLKADPRIKIIATGRGDEFQPEGLARGDAWNEAVLRAAAQSGARLPEWLSAHPLVPLPGDLHKMPYADQYESAMAHPAFLDRTLLPTLIRRIRSLYGSDAPTRIALTEWGIIVGGDRWWESPNHDVQAGAIFNALTLNALLRHSDWVTLANMTGLMHGGGIKKPNGVVIVDPQYYTQQLYAAARPRYPVATQWVGPGRDVPRRGYLPAVTDVPDIDVFSALGDRRRTLVAFVVNRNRTEARLVRLNVDGFAAKQVSATILSAPDPQARNTWERPDTVAPRLFTVPPQEGEVGWSVSLPPHSLVVFTFRGAQGH